MATRIKYEKEDRIGYITIYEEIERRPCTMDWDSLAMLEEAIKTIAADQEVRGSRPSERFSQILCGRRQH